MTKLEAIAEVTLSPEEGKQVPASPPSSFGFIISFGSEAFSTAVVPDGSGSLQPGVPQRVRLRFLFGAAGAHLTPGREFTFFESGRVGKGRIIEVCDADPSDGTIHGP